MTAPQWLEGFQSRFGEMLREPLDRTQGTLRPATESYDSTLCREARPGRTRSARGRLAVYNRQYWFRFFGVMAGAFPLGARLVGHWHFNGLVTQFLREKPPTGWDLDDVPAGFETFVERAPLPSIRVEEGQREVEVDRSAYLEATAIDAAWLRVFRAPDEPVYRPSAADAHDLGRGRLRLSARIAFIEEHWPFLALRRRLEGDTGESAVPVPPPHPEARSVALVRTRTGVGERVLDPLEARLFALLRDFPMAEGLARLEATIPASERATLPARTRDWLARSVRLGFWSGLDR
ncbi:MAG: DNA-binding domain-containing protein [Polyangiaceae bacterium]|nr:DNA-binding domain-containing protein [Polyangiaceae bacterium]